MSSLVSLLIAAVLLLSENTLRFFVHWDFKKSRLPIPRAILHSLLSLLPLLAFTLEELYLPALYLLFLLASYTQEKLIPLSGDCLDKLLRIRFSIFGSLHLYCIGVCAAFTYLTLDDMLSHPTYVLNCMNVALFFYSLLKLEPLLSKDRCGIMVHNTQQKDFQYLYLFLDLDVGYILLQSFFCLFHKDLNTTFSFFLCGNMISIILILAFINSLYRIRASHHTELQNARLAASLQKGQQQLTSLISTVHFDSLTGAHSRLFLIQEVTRLMDFQIPFSLVYMDLNSLKKINDTYGHVAGDKYLKEFADLMKLHIRQEDTFARFGGDEFILLLPRCDTSTAEERISTIQERMTSTYPFAAGCADTSESTDLEELITLADSRMYKNKVEGRGLRRA